MKTTLIAPFATASGRACAKQDVYAKTNKHNHKVVLVQLCDPYDGPATPKQQAVRDLMSQRTKAAKAWRALNAPTEQNPKGTAEYQACYKQWKTTSELDTWYAYLLSKFDKQTGKFPSFVDGSTPSAPSDDDDPDGIE